MTSPSVPTTPGPSAAPPRGRPRFRLRTLLALPLAAAVACLVVARIDPSRVDPDRKILDALAEWAGRRDFSTSDVYSPGSATPGPAGDPTRPCLVEMARISGHDFRGFENEIRCIADQSVLDAAGMHVGVTFTSRSIHGGGLDPPDPEGAARVRAILRVMPPAPWGVPVRDALLVGYLDPSGRWRTARDDLRTLPAAIRDLASLMEAHTELR